MKHFEIINNGTIVNIKPLTPEAKLWFNQNVNFESWQCCGDYVAIEPRMANDIIDGFNAEQEETYYD
jgi:Holliday junction resolvase-like predicted endonuclease